MAGLSRSKRRAPPPPRLEIPARRGFTVEDERELSDQPSSTRGIPAIATFHLRATSPAFLVDSPSPTRTPTPIREVAATPLALTPLPSTTGSPTTAVAATTTRTSEQETPTTTQSPTTTVFQTLTTGLSTVTLARETVTRGAGASQITIVPTGATALDPGQQQDIGASASAASAAPSQGVIDTSSEVSNRGTILLIILGTLAGLSLAGAAAIILRHRRKRLAANKKEKRHITA